MLTDLRSHLARSPLRCSFNSALIQSVDHRFELFLGEDARLNEWAEVLAETLTNEFAHLFSARVSFGMIL